ncbi:hypothetical protein BTO22_08920 [Aliivibrio sifiae]|uniref:Uncharacterized protein n=1 Tax=Aliivibrio sifiae TaxID=566293 RepID=A0A2S7XF46_9GAMM|nr:hypothetical protein BTO22_08920 [Aliivibrio sifiae]
MCTLKFWWEVGTSFRDKGLGRAGFRSLRLQVSGGIAFDVKLLPLTKGEVGRGSRTNSVKSSQIDILFYLYRSNPSLTLPNPPLSKGRGLPIICYSHRDHNIVLPFADESLRLIKVNRRESWRRLL